MQASSPETIDLAEVAGALWDGKWIIAGLTLLAAVASVVFALSQPNVYRASATYGPAPGQSQDALGGLPGSLRGLAGLAGASIGASGDQTDLALEILRSRKFIGDFVVRHNVLVPLFAMERWNPKTRRAIYDAEVYDFNRQKWVRQVSPPRTPQPSIDEAYRAFSDRLMIVPDDETGFVTISLEFYSPDLAKKWLGLLVADMNETLRRRDIKIAEASIDLLERQAERTTIADVRTILFKLIESHIQRRLLASVNQEYALQTIDPPAVPEKQVSPKRALICILGTLAGFLLGCFAALVRFFQFKRPANAPAIQTAR